jgi:hypothetical protein
VFDDTQCMLVENEQRMRSHLKEEHQDCNLKVEHQDCNQFEQKMAFHQFDKVSAPAAKAYPLYFLILQFIVHKLHFQSKFHFQHYH